MNYDWLIHNARRTTPGDIAQFDLATKDLPARGDGPYGSGPHCLQVFKLALDIIQLQGMDAHILEIGLNRGHGAAMWLSLGCTVTSIDISANRRAIDQLNYQGDGRFTFYLRNDLPEHFFDIAFIDGDHNFESVKADIFVCRRANIRWMLFDDFDPHHGPGVQPAIIDANLKMVALLGNMALCYDPINGEYKDVPRES